MHDLFEGLIKLVYIAKDCFGQVCFYMIFSSDYQLSQVTQKSGLYCAFNALPAYILLTIFIMIPFTMIGNILQNLTKRNGHVPKYEFKCFQLIKTYIYLRIILFIPLILLLTTNQVELLQIYSTIKVSLGMFDALICSVILIFSICLFQKHNNEIPLTNEDKIILKKQCMLMLGCSIVRISGNFIFLILLPITNPSRKLCISNIENHLFYSIGYVLFGSWFMHFIPLLFIVVIYTPKQLTDNIQSFQQAHLLNP